MQGGGKMHFTEAKTILTPQNGLNIYRGGPNIRCIYSPLRNTSSHVDDFEDVEVKENADSLLATALKKKRNKTMIIMGTLADPYVPEEMKLELTRKCLFEIKRYDFGVSIRTKSASIKRDIDIISEINEKTKAVVTIPFPTTDNRISGLIDPDMSAVSERTLLIEELSRRKIPVIVALDPIIPHINDTEESVLSVLSIAAGFGAFAIEYGDLKFTLSPGSREYFYKCIDERFPEVKPKYKDGFNKAMNVKTEEIASSNRKYLIQEIEEFCEKRSLISDQDMIRDYKRKYENKQSGEQLFFDF